jgi:hypothetical protein
LLQKTKDLNASCGPTMRKPKPAPKKEDPPKPEEKKPEETKDVTMEDPDKPAAPDAPGADHTEMDVDPK